MNTVQSLRHGLVGGMIGACLWSMWPAPVPAQELEKLRQARLKIDQLQEELESVKVQIEFLDLKMRDSRDHVRRLEEKSRSQKARVAELQKQLDALASESVELSDQIAGLQQEISRGESRSESILQRFRTRLRYLHKLRQGTLLTSIFSTNDLNTFLNRYQMVRYLLQYDRELLAELQKVRAKLMEDIDLRRRKQDRLFQVAQLVEKNRDALEVESTSLMAMLQSLLLEHQMLLARQKKLKQTYAQLENELARIEKSRQADPKRFDEEVSRKSAGVKSVVAPTVSQPGKASQPTMELSSTNSDAPPDLKVMGSGEWRFQWPLPVTASSLPADADLANWLDLPVRGDTEIKAAGAGKVYFKGPLGQFGNTVILAHRQGFTTLYGNLDELWVGLHQIVDPGEVLGIIRGGSGKSLRFEIRFGGKAQAPLKYLPPLK